MNEVKLVSIIIPVFNAEKYLKRCIDSLLAQTYQNWECILINDGSTDQSGIICENYKSKDSRIRVFHQPVNKGVSAARNTGLSEAVGDYVCFIDADDYIPDESLECRTSRMNDNSVLICGYEKCSAAGGVKVCTYDSKEFSGTEFVPFLFRNKPFGYQGYLWNKLFDLSLIKNNNITFDEDISYNEDRLFLLQYLYVCNNVKIINSMVYYYMENETCAMSVKKYNPKIYSDVVAYERMEKFIKDREENIFWDFYISFIKRCFDLCSFAKENKNSHAHKYKIIAIGKAIHFLLSKNEVSFLYKIKLLMKGLLL